MDTSSSTMTGTYLHTGGISLVFAWKAIISLGSKSGRMCNIFDEKYITESSSLGIAHTNKYYWNGSITKVRIFYFNFLILSKKCISILRFRGFYPPPQSSKTNKFFGVIPKRLFSTPLFSKSWFPLRLFLMVISKI